MALYNNEHMTNLYLACLSDLPDILIYSLFGSKVSSSWWRTVNDQVLVSSGEVRTECWHVHNPIVKLDHKCAGKIFNFNFFVVVQ